MIKKEFKAESKRLLDLMIHSIYTNKDIFLRELISNASDASDKLYLKSLQEESLDLKREELYIDLEIDENKLKVVDRGIGMNATDLEDYLGTIAKSNSHAIKEAMDDEDNVVDIIGQFGVGFYSAFMVSDKVEVISKAYGENQAYRFTSTGLDGYIIEESERSEYGTTVICHISNDEDNKTYLDKYTIKSLVQKYSDYIPYPIRMKNDEGEFEVLNSMIPLWKRSKADVTDEELNDFYKEKYFDFENPIRTIQMKVEGLPSFDALLYIPKKVPYNFYTQAFEPGLDLYSRGVFIMEHNKELIPEHFRFVRGLVDSPDLPLNISREILQSDRQLKTISNRVESRIKRELETMLRNDRESYEEFWKEFGLSIKYGVYSDFGMHKEKLQDLLLFYSSHNDELTTLSEYVNRMDENQEVIYYVSGDSLSKCKISPQAEFVRDKGFEVLYLIDEIDDFVMQMMVDYDDKPFKSVQQGDLDLLDEDDKAFINEKNKENKDLIQAIESALADHVDEVRLSTRLNKTAVCLVSDEGISFEMEKLMNALPEGDENVKAKRILEINPKHDLLSALNNIYETQPKLLDDYAHLLYDQACLIEGLELDNPLEFSNKMVNLMLYASEKKA